MRVLVSERIDRPAQAAVLEQVVAEQREGLELVDETAVLIDDAEAVGVAIGGEADVGAAVDDGLCQSCVRFRAIGSGATMPGKAGIALAA